MTRTSIAGRARTAGFFTASAPIALLLGCIGLFPTPAPATDLEPARLASQLNEASDQLSRKLLFAGGYHRVRQSADSLGREAERLVDAICRKRGRGSIRSRFREVTLRYQELEEVFLSAGDNRRLRSLSKDFDLVGDLYAALNNKLYYAGDIFQPPDSFYRPMPETWRLPPSRFNPRSCINSDQRQREQQPQRRNRRDHDRVGFSQQPRYDHRSRVLDRQSHNDAAPRHVEGSADRGDDGQVNASPRSRYDHRSRVLDRQSANDAGNRRVEGNANRRRDRGSETGRRYHYPN